MLTLNAEVSLKCRACEVPRSPGARYRFRCPLGGPAVGGDPERVRNPRCASASSRAKLLIIQDLLAARGPSPVPTFGPRRTPAMMPASTKGLRLFGSPMTSAGTPSTAASSATVELTVTTARLAPSSGASGADAGSTVTCGRPATRSAYTSGVSAGCGLDSHVHAGERRRRVEKRRQHTLRLAVFRGDEHQRSRAGAGAPRARCSMSDGVKRLDVAARARRGAGCR